MSYRIALTTLGCKVNQADSDHLAQAFRDAGCHVVAPDQPADAYVVNTCTVTLVADRKARKLVRGLAATHPGAVIAVTGCYAAGLGRAVLEAMPEVDLLRGTSDRDTLPQAVLQELRRRAQLGPVRWDESANAATAPRVRAMLKAQDGCNQVCAYCIVPSVRGGQRSRRCDDVVAEARERVRAGVRELVLCGIRLGAYGWDWPARRGSRFVPLQELVRALGEVAGLERLRLSSLLPLDIGPDLGRVLADTPVVCEHLHLPLQAGDDQVLRAMRRGYTTRRYREVVERLRAALPGVALATDVMVGFPGETAEQFARTLAFCRELAFADLHVFAYSPRPGTAAAALPDDVPPAEKHARSQALLALRAALRQEFAARWLGQSVTILVEECVHGAYEGLTRDYLRVRVAGVAPLGSLQPVTVTAIGPEVLVGQAAR